MGELGIARVKDFITLDDVTYRFVSNSGNSYLYEAEDGTLAFVEEEDALYYKAWEEELGSKQTSKSVKPLYSLTQRVLPSSSILLNPPYSSMRRAIWFEAIRWCDPSRWVTPLQVLKIYNRLRHGKRY